MRSLNPAFKNVLCFLGDIRQAMSEGHYEEHFWRLHFSAVLLRLEEQHSDLGEQHSDLGDFTFKRQDKIL